MKSTITLTAIAVLTSVVSAQPIMDGYVDVVEYGDVCVYQNNGTNFGDSLSGDIAYADGSELDSANAVISGDHLYIHLAGNLQSNYNKLQLFIDARDGGQNTILGTNPDVSYGALQRMGDDGSGNGLSFDEGITPDFYLDVTCGDNGFGTGIYSYVNYAELRTKGNGFGAYAGSGGSYWYQDEFGDWLPYIYPSTGDYGIEVAINNSNWGGVVSGAGEDCGAPENAVVLTGIEIKIPLALIDWDAEGLPFDNVQICAFITSGDHSYVSNQVLGGLGGMDNLGEVRDVNFSTIDGPQYFAVGDAGESCVALPTGACCFANGECWEDLTDDNCFASRGAWGGEGSACADCDLGGGNDCPSDVNGDGIVNVADILELIGAWGTVCP
ncbi:MAG: hypothetical protein ISR75_05800 [Phycisphaerales bacterium]|nr:hypothetical protein [Planctomycetota bacterium]MBL6997933.1 hypothetical protein [Phycisphaerales bacterium]